MERPMDSRGVEQDELTVIPMLDGEDSVARGLGLVRNDGNLVADDQIEERGFAGVGRPMSETTGAAARSRGPDAPLRSPGRSPLVASPLPALHRRFLRATEADLVDATALGFEDFDLQPVEIEHLADRRHTADARQHVAPTLEAPRRDRDVQRSRTSSMLAFALNTQEPLPSSTTGSVSTSIRP